MPQTTEQLRQKYRLLAVHWENVVPTLSQQALGSQLSSSPTQARRLAAGRDGRSTQSSDGKRTSKRVSCLAGSVEVLAGVEKRNDEDDEHALSFAEAFSAARRSDELRARFLITALALGRGQKPLQEPGRDGDKTKPKQQVVQPQPKAGSKRTRTSARKCRKCRREETLATARPKGTTRACSTSLSTGRLSASHSRTPLVAATVKKSTGFLARKNEQKPLERRLSLLFRQTSFQLGRVGL